MKSPHPSLFRRCRAKFRPRAGTARAGTEVSGAPTRVAGRVFRYRADVAHPLEDLTALDLDGESVRLGDLWKKKPVVLVFLRHFG